ncbi:MAG TPA: ferritin-like domain-containing protein [Lentimicrobium sp.]|nr:ferritin-like domain-containing protein [Lentimicrobium sp.]
MKDSGKNNQKRAITGAAKGLHDLFTEQLKDIYGAEKALYQTMPTMLENATSEDLIAAIEKHRTQTENQIKRLEQVFESVGMKVESKKCEAMEGLIREAENIIKETESGMVRDAAIIASAQKIEHYEIATYGTLSSFAHTLDEMDAYDLLEETLDEEKETDLLLTEIAEARINIEAIEGGEDE